MRPPIVSVLRDLGVYPENQWPVPDADFLRKLKAAEEELTADTRDQTTRELLIRLGEACEIEARDVDEFAEQLKKRNKHADDLLALANEMYAFVRTNPDFCDAEADELPERARELGIDTDD